MRAKTRWLRLALALVGAMAMILPVTPAYSSPSVLAGVPGAVCAISGTTNTPSGIPLIPNGSTGNLSFTGLALQCAGPKAGSGTFTANVSAETTDPFHSTIGNSVLASGTKSFRKTDTNKHSNGLGDVEYHTAKFVADNGTDVLYGKLHFVTLGVVALADGYVWKNNQPGDWDEKKKKKIVQKISAYIIAVPNFASGVPPTQAIVNGPAVIWDPPLVEAQVECGGQPNSYNNNKPVEVKLGLGLDALSLPAPLDELCHPTNDPETAKDQKDWPAAP